jgi:hypothetical protein
MNKGIIHRIQIQKMVAFEYITKGREISGIPVTNERARLFVRIKGRLIGREIAMGDKDWRLNFRTLSNSSFHQSMPKHKSMNEKPWFLSVRILFSWPLARLITLHLCSGSHSAQAAATEVCLLRASVSRLCKNALNATA